LEVGAGRQVAVQAELGQDQRARALRADQLPSGIKLDLRQQRSVGHDLARLDPAADDDRVRFARERQRLLAPNGDAIHRGHFGRWRRDVSFPALGLDTIQNRGGDERIQFVEAVECQDCYLHGCPPSSPQR
jgi:hypothetical protein